MNVTAILLAAGYSSRMGRNKLLLPWNGSTVIRTIAERLLATAADEVVVVLGHQGEAVREALSGLDLRLVVNVDFARGMSTSLAAGVRAANASVEALLIMLGDMPRVSSALLKAVIERAVPDRIVVPRIGKREGNPVLFGAAFRDELIGIHGDRGAREVIEAHRDRVEFVDWSSTTDFEDIDLPEDL